MNKQRRFIFKKAYTNSQGTLPEGSQIDIVHDTFYFNGGMCDMYSSSLFKYLVYDEKMRKEYLTEVEIPVDKI